MEQKTGPKDYIFKLLNLIVVTFVSLSLVGINSVTIFANPLSIDLGDDQQVDSLPKQVEPKQGNSTEIESFPNLELVSISNNSSKEYNKILGEDLGTLRLSLSQATYNTQLDKKFVSGKLTFRNSPNDLLVEQEQINEFENNNLEIITFYSPINSPFVFNELTQVIGSSWQVLGTAGVSLEDGVFSYEGNFEGEPGGYLVTAVIDRNTNDLILSSPVKHNLTFTVNSGSDNNDNNLGDGLCADVNGDCTLRAAISEIMDGFASGPYNIEFDIPASDNSYRDEDAPTVAGSGDSINGDDYWQIDIATEFEFIFQNDVTINGQSQSINRGDTHSEAPELTLAAPIGGIDQIFLLEGQNITISGFNFSSNTGIYILINGADTVDINNSNFDYFVDGTQSSPGGTGYGIDVLSGTNLLIYDNNFGIDGGYNIRMNSVDQAEIYNNNFNLGFNGSIVDSTTAAYSISAATSDGLSIYNNVIAGNGAGSIRLSSVNTTNIYNNNIGVDANGTGLVGNATGSAIVNIIDSFNIELDDNIIASNSQANILIDSGEEVRIINNRVGVDDLAENALGNANYGIQINNYNGDFYIGAEPGLINTPQGNTIGGAGFAGIWVDNVGLNNNSMFIKYNNVGISPGGGDTFPNNTNNIPVYGGLVLNNTNNIEVLDNYLAENNGTNLAILSGTSNVNLDNNIYEHSLTDASRSVYISDASDIYANSESIFTISNTANLLEVVNSSFIEFQNSYFDGSGSNVGSLISNTANLQLDSNYYDSLDKGVVLVNGATSNEFRFNAFTNIADLAIDLGNDGATPNDTDDIDTGENDLQNYPIITNITHNSGNNFTVEGNIDSNDGNFTLAFCVRTLNTNECESPLALINNVGDGAFSETINYFGSNNGTQSFELTAYLTNINGSTSELSPTSLDSQYIGDSTPPTLEAFSSSSVGTFGPASNIIVTAEFDEPISAGSLEVELSNGVILTLDNIDNNNVSGTYNVGATGSGEDILDLEVSNINSINVDDSLGNSLTAATVPASNIDGINVDVTGPQLLELNAVETPTTDTTPEYQFNTSENGIGVFGGSCDSNVSKTFLAGSSLFELASDNSGTPLEPGIYSDCTIQLTDQYGNTGNILDITEFEILAPPTEDVNPDSADPNDNQDNNSSQNNIGQGGTTQVDSNDDDDDDDSTSISDNTLSESNIEANLGTEGKSVVFKTLPQEFNNRVVEYNFYYFDEDNNKLLIETIINNFSPESAIELVIPSELSGFEVIIEGLDQEGNVVGNSRTLSTDRNASETNVVLTEGEIESENESESAGNQLGNLFYLLCCVLLVILLIIGALIYFYIIGKKRREEDENQNNERI